MKTIWINEVRENKDRTGYNIPNPEIHFMKTIVSKIIVQYDDNIRLKLVNSNEISSVEVTEDESYVRTKEICDENSSKKGTDNPRCAG